MKLLDAVPRAGRRRAERGRGCARRDRRRRGAARDAGRESLRRRRSRPARRRKASGAASTPRSSSRCPTGGGAPLTSTAAASSTAIATTLSPSRLRPTPGGVSPRSSRGRTNVWWNPPQASATQTSPIFTSSVWPYEVVQRSDSSGRRWIDDERPGDDEHPDQERPRCARSGETPRGGDPARAARRRPRGSGRRRPRASPSTRCTQSAISVSAVEFGSVPWCPESG